MFQRSPARKKTIRRIKTIRYITFHEKFDIPSSVPKKCKTIRPNPKIKKVFNTVFVPFSHHFTDDDKSPRKDEKTIFGKLLSLSKKKKGKKVCISFQIPILNFQQEEESQQEEIPTPRFSRTTIDAPLTKSRTNTSETSSTVVTPERTPPNSPLLTLQPNLQIPLPPLQPSQPQKSLLLQNQKNV